MCARARQQVPTAGCRRTRAAGTSRPPRRPSLHFPLNTCTPPIPIHPPTHHNTQAPLFTQKADLFHKSVFVVGYDTAVRLVKPEYYGSDQAMLLQVRCQLLSEGGCSTAGLGRARVAGHAAAGQSQQRCTE